MARRTADSKGCLTIIAGALLVWLTYEGYRFVKANAELVALTAVGLALLVLSAYGVRHWLLKAQAQAELDKIEALHVPPPSHEAGWYPDPLSGAQLRAWDGLKWTTEKKDAFRVFRSAKELNFKGVYVYSYPIYEQAVKSDGTALYKIGMTNTTIFERVVRQSRSTEVPEDAVIRRAYATDEPLRLEQAIHAHFTTAHQKSKRGGTEWFWVTLEAVDEAAKKLGAGERYMDSKSYLKYRKELL